MKELVVIFGGIWEQIEAHERQSDGGGGCEDPRIPFVESLQRQPSMIFSKAAILIVAKFENVSETA
jgi:hypothetical protein